MRAAHLFALALALVGCKKSESPPPAPAAQAPAPPAPAVPSARPAARDGGPPVPAVARAPGRPVPLKGGAFWGEGFRIERVPEGARFFAIDGDDDPPTWEVRDAGGKRIARIVEEPWHHAGSPAVGESATKVGGVSTRRREEERTDWGGSPARVIHDVFEAGASIYHVERRAGASADWVVEGWKLIRAGRPARLQLGRPKPSLFKLDLPRPEGSGPAK